MPEQAPEHVVRRSTTREAPLVVADEIAKSFGLRWLWRGVSFAVRRGEMLAVTGRSGAGKSTLLNCLGLLDTVDHGAIDVAGTDVTGFGYRAARRFRRDTVGYLFQNYALVENATVRDNLSVAVAGRRHRARDYEAVLEQVGLAGHGGDHVYCLSGGEQQRVAVARLLLKQPSVVLADEPTGALDVRNADMVVDILRDLAARGCAVIIGTHDQRVESRCDTSLALDHRPS